jgi:hypothetical protein
MRLQLEDFLSKSFPGLLNTTKMNLKYDRRNSPKRYISGLTPTNKSNLVKYLRDLVKYFFLCKPEMTFVGDMKEHFAHELTKVILFVHEWHIF